VSSASSSAVGIAPAVGGCKICDSSALAEIETYSSLARVTSDCKGFPRGGRLVQCESCGAVQKRDDAAWRADCAAIYAGYDNYSLSGGVEQSVRSVATGEYAPRSELVLKELATRLALPARGVLLDYGCGKGPTSRAAAKVLPGWSIDGYDLDTRAQDALRRIPGFRHLYAGDRATIAGRYDLIVLTHTLEHIPDAREALASLASKLGPGGRIVVQVYDRVANPYDLIVADHILHFDATSLRRMCEASGLVPALLARNIISKELTLVASRESPIGTVDESPPLSPRFQVDWLARSADACRSAASRRPFGLFGTSIVATWLTAELGAPPDFYVDEDPAKVGLEMEGAPILAPKDMPSGATVLFAMAPLVAAAVQSRLRELPVTFVLPPDYPAL
jgi:SAM-dependent methyltransferase